MHTYPKYHTHISIHALREEGDFILPTIIVGSFLFLSTPSARRATILLRRGEVLLGDFYPRPPRGGRPPEREHGTRKSYFYPRPPRGGRRDHRAAHHYQSYDFYPRPPRGGRPTTVGSMDSRGHISIHALREEGDVVVVVVDNVEKLFLSTPSARRATDFQYGV